MKYVFQSAYLYGDHRGGHLVPLCSSELEVQRDQLVIHAMGCQHDISVSELNAGSTCWLKDSTTRILRRERSEGREG